MIFQPLTVIEAANFESKMLVSFILQTLMNASLKTSVIRMLHATTPKDLTAALVKMDLKATEKTALVRLCGVHGPFWPFCKGSSEAKSSKTPIFRLNSMLRE